VILLAKSEMHTIDVRHELENQVCQRTHACETNFASSIKSDDDPNDMKLIESHFFIGS
jgi:hypothetical protein